MQHKPVKTRTRFLIGLGFLAIALLLFASSVFTSFTSAPIGAFLDWRIERSCDDIDMSVPTAGESENIRSKHGIVVNVGSDGSILFKGEVLGSDEFSSKLRKIVETYPDQLVILRSDLNPNFQAIVDVLDSIKAAGIWNVNFEGEAFRPSHSE